MSAADGGPAFPSGMKSDDLTETEVVHPVHAGLSLRDYFAAKALSAVVAAIMPQECHRWSPADFASEAYLLADAMIAARNK